MDRESYVGFPERKNSKGNGTTSMSRKGLVVEMLARLPDECPSHILRMNISEWKTIQKNKILQTSKFSIVIIKMTTVRIVDWRDAH